VDFTVVAPSQLLDPRCSAPLVLRHVPQFPLTEVLARLPAAGRWFRSSLELLSCAWVLLGLLEARVLCLAPRSKLHRGANSADVKGRAINEPCQL
jgi:hypothetical protein